MYRMEKLTRYISNLSCKELMTNMDNMANYTKTLKYLG